MKIDNIYVRYLATLGYGEEEINDAWSTINKHFGKNKQRLTLEVMTRDLLREEPFILKKIKKKEKEHNE